MNNNNKKQSNLQFTELTPDDIAIHEDIYINMLVDLAPNTPMKMGVITKAEATGVPSVTARIYYEYAIKEVQKANDIFQETFG